MRQAKPLRSPPFVAAVAVRAADPPSSLPLQFVPRALPLKFFRNAPPLEFVRPLAPPLRPAVAQPQGPPPAVVGVDLATGGDATTRADTSRPDPTSAGGSRPGRAAPPRRAPPGAPSRWRRCA